MAMSVPDKWVQADDQAPLELTVRRFYDAVNLQIETGDPSALNDVLHPDFSDNHPLPGLTSGSDGLASHVASLHVNAPGARIVVDSTTTDGNEVTAIVSMQVNGVPPEAISGFLSPSLYWHPLEHFRISGDRIIERTSPGRGLIMVQERFEGLFEADPSVERAFSVNSLTFEKTGSTRLRSTGGPAVLHVTSGELAVTMMPSEFAFEFQPSISHYADPGNDIAVRSGQVVSLREGATLTVPHGVTFVASGTTAPATAIHVSTVETSVLGTGIQTVPQVYDGISARLLGPLPHGSSPGGVAGLKVHRILLMPGAWVARDDDSGLLSTMVWLDTGKVLTETAHTMDQASGMRTANRQFVSGVQLSSDDGLAYSWPAGATLHNSGSDPAILWAISVELPELSANQATP